MNTELTRDTKRIVKLLVKAQEAFKIVEYLYKTESKDISFIKRSNFFLVYSRSIYWQTTVIELSKLFYFKDGKKSETEKTERRERYNLRLFIDRLKSNEFYGTNSISLEKMIRWIELLDEQDTNILNLLKQRDKVYAHEDEDNEDIENEVSLADIKKILGVAYLILNEIHHNVFNQGISYEPTPSPLESLQHIVKDVEYANAMRMDRYRELAKAYDLEGDLPATPVLPE